MPDETDWVAVCLAAGRISDDDAAKLEARLASRPDDLRTRVQLLGHYVLKQGADKRAARDQHVLWVIANHPELDLGPYTEITEDLSPLAYAEAKLRWRAAIAQQPTNATILTRASHFFMVEDPALAEQWLRRGVSLQPEVAHWRAALAQLRMMAAEHEETDGARVALGREALREYEGALALEPSPVGRYGLLIDAAKAAFVAKEYEGATGYAERVLAEAKEFEGTWIYGNGIHHGHIVLGRVALVGEDVASARDHLVAAGATPGSPQLNSFGPDQQLAVELLARGQRDAVIAYAEACKRFYGGGLGMIGAAYRKPDESGA